MSVGKQIIGLIVWVVACEAVGGISSLFTFPSIPGWYAGLRKPSWTPPNAVFGPVWTTLYLLMGIAAWLVWRQWGKAHVVPGLVLFLVQLVLNFLWSFFFFGRHLTGAALVNIGALWVAILLTIVFFWPVSWVAGVLLVPYLLWVSYASTLNYALWRLNAR